MACSTIYSLSFLITAICSFFFVSLDCLDSRNISRNSNFPTLPATILSPKLQMIKTTYETNISSSSSSYSNSTSKSTSNSTWSSTGGRTYSSSNASSYHSNSTNTTVITRNYSWDIPPSPLPEIPLSPLPDIPPSPLPEIPPSPLPGIMPPTPKRHLTPSRIPGFVGGALAIIFLVVILVLVIRRCRRKSGKTDKGVAADNEEVALVHDDPIKQVPGMPVRFSYEDLCNATKNFTEMLVKGAFGSVYRGLLEDGTNIAAKKLEKLGDGMDAPFLAEAEAIGCLHHFNLVRFIGFCAENSFRILVFEYMSNGSLDKWIFKNDQRSWLDWQTRKKIILDIAKRLAYLHEDCRQKVIHFDIKPQNILLDANFNAKISDFGLSKLIDRDISQFQSPMRGTLAYIAPECCKLPQGSITVKVDIYSFGIVLLEIVCARRNVDPSQPDSDFHLLKMLQRKAAQDRLIDMVEKNLDDQIYMPSPKEEIIRMIKIAAWCLQDDPIRRPLMSTVVKVLEGVMEVDSNLVYEFAHSLLSSPVVNDHIASAPPSASVLSGPR